MRKSILGVTLLEIMLVLAIASMVVVMSIRYYQSASNNQKLTAAVNTITGVVAAGESVLAEKGTLGNVVDEIPKYLPKNTISNSPWGGPLIVASTGPMSYTITMNIPTAGNTCTQFAALINQNSKTTAVCGASSVVITVSG